jgi:hypothetical protein
MSSKQVVLFIILVFIIVIPSVNAQEITIDKKTDQKSIEVVINSSNEIHVKHVIASLNSPKQIELIKGTITNITVSNEEGKEKKFEVIGNNDGVKIFPSQENTIIEYDLGDALFLKNNVWTWDFLYLETTSFTIPKEADLIFVNDKPVYLDGKNGISCHGCQMILEYSINEPKILKNVKLDNKEFLIGIRTFAEINQFNFDQSTKSIGFEVNGKNQFVTIIIPLELLPKPYNVFMGDKKILFHEFNNNGTHVWLNIRPNNSGNVSIISTTVIDDEKLAIQNNPSTPESSVNQDIIVYILFGVIILIGLVVTVIIMRKKKSSTTSKEI